MRTVAGLSPLGFTSLRTAPASHFLEVAANPNMKKLGMVDASEAAFARRGLVAVHPAHGRTHRYSGLGNAGCMPRAHRSCWKAFTSAPGAMPIMISHNNWIDK
jgi:hypothetical protein